MKKILYSLLLISFTACLGGGGLNNEGGIPGVGLIPTDKPVLTATSPTSPAIDSTPTLLGTSEENANIVIYSDASCTQQVATTTADSSGNFSVNLSLQGDTTTTFYATAKAENKLVSECSSSSITYRNNTITPGVAWLNGTTTTAPSNSTRVNQATAYPIQWSSSEFDSSYYSHSTTTNSHRITIEQGGDYFLSVTMPLVMASGTYRPVTRIEVRVNGSLKTTGVGESTYIRYEDQEESSGHINVLLRNLSQNDFIEITTEETAGQAGDEVVNITGQASLYLEYLDSNRNIFNGYATQTTGGPNLNQGVANPLIWTEERKGSAFEHSNSTNPENIELEQNGSYLVFVNVPIEASSTRVSPRLLVQVNDTTVDGGQAAQGYMRNDSGHNNASLHWSGVIHNVSANDILKIKTQQDNTGGTVNVSTGTEASIMIEYLGDNPNEIISLRANALSGGTNWNPASAESILWQTSDLQDTDIFTHSTATNPEQITVDEPGDYLLIYNDVLISPSAQRSNPKIKVQINGTDLTGAEVKSHYARNTTGHQVSSGSLVFFLRNLAADDVVSLTTEQEGIAGTVNDLDDAILTVIKK